MSSSIRRNRAFIVLSLSCVSALCAAQPLAVPNASFEAASIDATAPADWRLSGGVGDYRTDAADGARCISLTGNGATADTNHWRTDDLAFDPFTIYQLSFQARRVAGTGGCPISGPVFCNRDLFDLDENWKTCTSIFVSPSEPRPGGLWLRFSQWEVNGTVAYDDVRLLCAQPIYRAKDGIILGEGESAEWKQVSFAVPAYFYPANEIWIRLGTRAARDLTGDSDFASFQLYDYTYSATLENTALEFRGATRCLAIERLGKE